MALTANESNILKLVAGLFNGAPGKNIGTDLSSIVAAGTSLSELADILVGTLEFQGIVPAGQAAQADFLLTNFGFDPAATDDATTVAKAFVNDNFELGLGQLAYLAVEFLNTTTDPLFADAAALLNNKALVAEVHAENVDAIADVAAGQAAFVGVTASGPTTPEDALTLLEDNGVVVPDPGQTGETFTLTINQDTISGTADNDTFNAGAVQDFTGKLIDTLQDVDTINGGEGTDTLNVTLVGTAGTVTPVLQSVENVNTRFTTADNKVLDLSASTGVDNITVANSTKTGVVSSVGDAALAVKNQNVAVSFDKSTATTLNLALDTVGVVSATAATQVAVDLGASVASKATSLNITTNASNVEVKDTTGANVATAATIAATGENELVLTDGAALASLTVTGTGSVDVSGVDLVKVDTLTVGDGGITFDTGDSTATTFSATTGAGKDTLTVDGANVKTISTGAGDDSVTTATAALAATASINLGAGDDTLTLHAASAAGATLTGGDDKDTLAVAAVDFVTISGYGATDLAKITGFEVLSLTDAAVLDTTAIDLSKIDGLTGFQSKGVDNGGTATVSNVGANADIIFKGDLATNDGALTVSLKDATGSSDAVNLTIDTAITQDNDGTVDTTAATVTTTIAGVETINVNSTGTLSAAVTAGSKTDIAANTLALTDTSLTTLNVTGDQALSFTSGAAMVKLATIDASAATAGLTFSGVAADMTTPTTSVAMTIKGSATAENALTGSGHADTITGGSARDVIIGGKGGDTITGNGGNDKFSFAAGDSSIGTGKFDTITDFVANTKGVGTDGALTAVGATGVDVADLTGDVLSFGKFGTGAGGVVVDVLGSGADATTFLATNAGTANAVIAALDSSASNLYVDNTGDGVADFFIHLNGVTTIDTGAFELV